jgi:predicted dehydrogenase
MKVKIYGAGSIGTHLAQASRRMGWSVAIVDPDKEALRRMKEETYPTRYGEWDSTITLHILGEEPKGGFDIIMLGTPPHVRMPLAIEVLKEQPRLLQLEKPLCGPNLEGLDEFLSALSETSTIVVSGYDHAISTGIEHVADLLKQGAVGEVLTIDVDFRQDWAGIFKVHPWLAGPEETYLGFRSKGGGASGEHSHALHLWQYLAGISGFGSWKKMTSSVKMEEGKNGAAYDSLAAFTFLTDTGKIGRVVQDIVTSPSRQWARVQGTRGSLEWECNASPKGDVVRIRDKDGVLTEEIFEKIRRDDFYRETLHMQALLDGSVALKDSPISLESAVSVMKVLSTAYRNPDTSWTDITAS